MNPAGAYLLNGYTTTTDVDIDNRKYDCTKALLCLGWAIIVTCAGAYIVGLVQGDLNDNCTQIVAVFGGIDLLWTIAALTWFSTSFTRKKTEYAFRDILLAYFVPLYTIGLNITVFKCRQDDMNMLYAWSVSWHLIMTGVIFIGCIITIIRCCTSMSPEETRVTFRERISDIP